MAKRPLLVETVLAFIGQHLEGTRLSVNCRKYGTKYSLTISSNWKNVLGEEAGDTGKIRLLQDGKLELYDFGDHHEISDQIEVTSRQWVLRQELILADPQSLSALKQWLDGLPQVPTQAQQNWALYRLGQERDTLQETTSQLIRDRDISRETIFEMKKTRSTQLKLQQQLEDELKSSRDLIAELELQVQQFTLMSNGAVLVPCWQFWLLCLLSLICIIMLCMRNLP